jgi:DNA-directed RNA polymerase specialized sigma subunit
MEYSNSQIREIIGEYIHSERDRKIMIRRLVDDITLEKLAEEFDLSVSQTKRIVSRHMMTVFSHVRK